MPIKIRVVAERYRAYSAWEAYTEMSFFMSR